jgi:hypothetical protein
MEMVRRQSSFGAITFVLAIALACVLATARDATGDDTGVGSELVPISNT